MQTHSQRMREIIKQDNARRAAQRITEDCILGISMIEDANSDAARIKENTTRGAYVNPCLVRGIGTVNPPMPTSASRNTWDAFKSARIGVAPGTEDTATVPTVLVHYADGTSEVKPVSAFRTPKQHRRAPRQIKSATVAETALHSPALRHDFTS